MADPIKKPEVIKNGNMNFSLDGKKESPVNIDMKLLKDRDLTDSEKEKIANMFKPAELKSSDESWLSQLKDKDEEIAKLTKDNDKSEKAVVTAIIIATITAIALVISWVYFIAHYLIYKH